MARESTMKALSFTDAFGPFSRGKFGQSDGIDIHGIRVRGGSRRGRVRGERESSSFQSKDTHFLCVECLGLLDPGSHSGWDGCHGEDHGGELLVESKRELVNEGDFVGNSCSGREVLKVGDILLESVVSDSIRVFE